MAWDLYQRATRRYVRSLDHHLHGECPFNELWVTLRHAGLLCLVIWRSRYLGFSDKDFSA